MGEGAGGTGGPVAQALQGVVFHALESRDESVLFDVQPAFVVMYDPDISFIRQLEVASPRPPCPRPLLNYY